MSDFGKKHRPPFVIVPPPLRRPTGESEAMALAHPDFFDLCIGLAFVGVPLPPRWSAAEAKRRRRAMKRAGSLPMHEEPYDMGRGVDLPELRDLGT